MRCPLPTRGGDCCRPPCRCGRICDNCGERLKRRKRLMPVQVNTCNTFHLFLSLFFLKRCARRHFVIPTAAASHSWAVAKGAPKGWTASTPSAGEREREIRRIFKFSFTLQARRAGSYIGTLSYPSVGCSQRRHSRTSACLALRHITAA